MTHYDAGNYAGKHQPGVTVDEKVTAAIKRKIVNGELACAQASRIAGSMKIDLKIVGTALDLMEVRITKCQLGLFGHEKGAKLVKPAKIIKTDMEEAIRSALVDGRLPCAAAWEIAAKFGVPKMRVASLCEALKIKIISCQLGAFK
ncbi:MAG: hypothetical protein JXA41_02075 [Deltaproteobacteria bacterium]|nr:hypothetical protein [Deltaproteobacteria bacterium]